MTLNGAMALLRYFTEFTYNVVLKQLLLGLHPFPNLLLTVYDHINYDLRDYSASIWAKQQEVTGQPRVETVRSGLDERVHFQSRFNG